MDLFDASHEGRIDIVRELLEAGADPNIKNEDGETALIIASSLGHYEIVKLLLEAGVDINIQNSYGNTALIRATLYATDYEYLGVVELLLNSGADPTIQGQGGDTALAWAEMAGEEWELVDLLKRHMASTRIQSRFIGRQTRRNARTQKADRRLSLAKSMAKPSTYSKEMRYEPNVALNISKYLSRMPYNPEVTRRMKEEDERV